MRVTFDKTHSVFNIISKQFLQGQMGQLAESKVNKSIKDEAYQICTVTNLHVLDDRYTYCWTVYLITQIAILIINCILVCKLYICHVKFTK